MFNYRSSKNEQSVCSRPRTTFNSVAIVKFSPVVEDFSNLKQQLSILNDPDRMAEITERAYIDIVKSGKWSYERFIVEMENNVLPSVGRRKKIGPFNCWLLAQLASLKMKLHDYLCWQYIKYEVEEWKETGLFKKLYFKFLKNKVVPISLD